MTETILADPRCLLLRAEALDALALLQDASVDALVTDPPAGISFMNKGWDSDKGGRDAWVEWLAGILRECLRVLKPGAYGTAWALPRTSHWTACAIEDAGFEIVDRVSHLFGQGMPKSIDMARQIDMHLCSLPGRHYDKHLPARGRREGDHLCPEHPARACAEGVRSALKPGGEDWWLFRKPREGTYAENFLAHGVGGLWIDACRIECSDKTPFPEGIVSPTERVFGGGGGMHGDRPRGGDAFPEGRWPTNVVFSHDPWCMLVGEGVTACVPTCAVRMLDAQSGVSKTRPGRPGRGSRAYEELTDKAAIAVPTTGREHYDSGGASRFFYCAKPARTEKEAGCDDLRARTGGEATGREDGDHGVANPRAGAGRTGGAKNHHPSVKSVDLMRWLVRLITPPGGVVLDPFTGSGTTGVAALAEGCSFIGAERDLDDATGGSLGYAAVAEGRLRHALAEYPAPAGRTEDK